MNKPFSTNFLERKFRKKLPKKIFDFISGGAGGEKNLERNKEIFDEHLLLPKILHGISNISTQTRIQSMELDFPLMVAPMALAKLCHPKGEIAIASACKNKKINFIHSTMSSSTMEETSLHNNLYNWFQLYPFKDDGFTQELLNRAKSSGFSAIIITIDMPVMAKRIRDLENNFQLPKNISFANLITMESTSSSPLKFTNKIFHPALDWKYIEKLKDWTTLPILIKGLIKPNDIDHAIKVGLNGAIISNHGGRQLDGTPHSIEILPKNISDIRNSFLIGVDSGVRNGRDIFISLALGANFVCIGRPILWALANGGQQTIERLLTILKEELIETMHLCGTPSIASIFDDRETFLYRRN